HSENERRDCVDSSLRQPIQRKFVVCRLVEGLVYGLEVGGIDGFESDKNPPSPTGRNQIQKFFVFQQVDADLCNPRHSRILRDDVAQQRLGAVYVDGEIVVDEKDAHLTAFFLRSPFQAEQFIHNALIRSKADGVAKKAGHCAEIAAVGATS